MFRSIKKSPSEVKNHQEYQLFKKQRYREIRRHRGWLRWIWDHLLRWFSIGVALEARDDWLRVRQLADKAESITIVENQITPKSVNQLATASAYLELARETNDLAETWGFVNQADEILCTLESDKNYQQDIFRRLGNWEPLLDRWLVELYGDSDKGKEVVKGLKANRDAVQADPCKALTVHSQQWTLINQWISFSRRLWRLAVIVLASTLLLSIWAAEYLTHETNTTTTVDIPYPYVSIAILGLFGGALSALRTARARKVTAITYGQSKSQVFVRLLLGAAGAFVIYILVNLPGFLDDNVTQYLTKIYGFLALGIVAGFSEQIFNNSLEKLASKFPTSSGQDNNQT